MSTLKTLKTNKLSINKEQAFIIVAINTASMPTSRLSLKTTACILPRIYAVKALDKALTPINLPVKRSSNKPHINPYAVPFIAPFIRAKKLTNINTRSGTVPFILYLLKTVDCKNMANHGSKARIK
jgi:hypothetical protein